MADELLLEEQFAPNQFHVLVTCIFLNKTEAVRAEPYLRKFLRRYPTPASLQTARPDDIKRDYFATLGLQRRAWWLKELASQLLFDPPRPRVMRRKDYKNAGYASEVAHLKGVGNYATDAWRLFCKEHFYAMHQIDVEDEWKRVQPTDKALRKYVEQRQQEEELISGLGDLRISNRKVLLKGKVIGKKPFTMFVPQRFIDSACEMAEIKLAEGSRTV